jgi:MoxR-like ATPase
MNPRERAGVEELSDVLLDRFDVIKMGYPESPGREKEIIKRYGARMDGIEVPEKVLDSIVSIVRATREEPWQKELDQSASVRASLSLYEKVQAMALLNEHSAATKEDVKRVAVSAMGGRIKPSPESKFYEEPSALIDEIVANVLGR